MTKEEELQIAVANYLRTCYPEVFFTHIINERDTMPQNEAMYKQLGVRKGMPDMLIFEPISEKDRFGDIIWIKKCGLALEFKTSMQKLTYEQKSTLVQLTGYGWKTAVCYSLQQAKQIIDNYFSENKKIQY